jgi:hypothetical protein
MAGSDPVHLRYGLLCGRENKPALGGRQMIKSMHVRYGGPATATIALALGLTACQPTVKVEAPDKPIVINMNVKIEQEVRVKLEKDVEQLLTKNEELF